MVRTAEEAVMEYREALDDLKDNNKMQINLMTILAEDYSSFSREIVHVIAHQVEKVLPTQKLAVMYVLDSILKNVTSAGNYKEHMEKLILKLFVHVFETGDEKTRLSLHKLRQTWTGIFQRSTLYKIDLAVNEIDPAWPIMTPQPATATPLSTSSSTSASPSTTSSSTSSASVAVTSSSTLTQSQQQQQQQQLTRSVHLNPHFFNKHATTTTVTQPSSVTEKRQLSTTVVEGKPMADPRLARLTENGRTHNNLSNGNGNAINTTANESKSRVLNNKSASFSSLVRVKDEPRDCAEDVDERRGLTESSSEISMKGYQRRFIEKKKMTVIHHMDEETVILRKTTESFASSGTRIVDYYSGVVCRDEERRDKGGRSPSDAGASSKKRRPPLKQENDEDAVDEKRRRAAFTRSPPDEKRRDHYQPSTSTAKQPPLKPTNDLGSHAFMSSTLQQSMQHSPSHSNDTNNTPPIINSINQAPSSSPPLTAPSTATSSSSSIDYPNVSSTSNVTTSSIITSSSAQATIPPSFNATSAPPAIAMPIIPMVPFPGMNPMLASRFMPPMVVPPQIAAAAAGALIPPVVAPATQHVIRTEGTKLEGIPANNRIFVDGRAYEVFYVNDIPVIERNGLPHRIYFTGAPRNVIIDGVAHLMNFGEEKRVVIDGEEHILKFGAPSRELYMGNYPFKGAFGGPPIFATINGVRHEIRLSGPPPEVKIEPDPCYELLRHMPRQGLNPASVTRPPNAAGVQSTGASKEPTMDVKGLLAKLQESGILSALNAKKDDKAASNSTKNTSQRDYNKSPTPPIPSEHRGEVTERLPKPPTDLKKFSMRALKIRYDSVVESLHQTKHLCPSCGLRFNELKGEAYERHLDWHFRENLRANEGSQCRSWYLSSEDWLTFSEQDSLTASTSTARMPGDSAQVDDASDVGKVVANVSCDAVQMKECGVCGEQFEEYWDEDDDAWKLKECMLGADGRPFHPSCILDASTAPTDTSKSDRMETNEEDVDHASDQALLQAANRILKNDLLLLNRS
ncbi:unnamed protein product [Anisakis simplex]|uniref:Polyadenylation and cleavage factor homolog 11 (inferred by orthology to a C. elegans protein) n=1 Tax=Anisakis simplex TaxID=6269 RepID=A0A0M3IYC7_ANISI|nr:unnamed protein product [Anisakis simplex]